MGEIEDDFGDPVPLSVARLLAPARASLKRYVFGPAYRILPPVVPARLGPDAGLVGAATLALRVGG